MRKSERKTEADRSKDLLRQNLETRARTLAGESGRILRQDPAGALTLAVQAKRMTEEKNFQTPKRSNERFSASLARNGSSPRFHRASPRVLRR